jgi:lipopolysaccharide transport system ATP-binding protein
MTDIAIKVENISKQYRIGAHNDNKNLREALKDAFMAPFRRSAKLFRGKGTGTAELDETIWALKDVSFDINQGEVVGFIGRNGAGKSTILKILSRITDPTHGFAVIKGRVGSLLEVGTGFHSELSGRENIYLNGAILGMRRTEIDQNFDEIVAFSEVEKFIDTPVKHYSSGMYLRLAFAVAAHLKPEILIVDEVLAVGDADFQKKCLGKMNTVSKEGRTVLFVSHNMAAIANLCTKAILLQEGRVVLIGNTTEVINSYVGQASNLAKIQLSSRKDRKGTGNIRVIAIEFLNQDKNFVANGISGKELAIRMRYKAMDGRAFKSCRASIAVTRNQQLYFNLSTELVETKQLILSGEGHIDFIIPEVPLSESTYMIHTYIESKNEIMDWVSDAAEMRIIDGDYYGTGKNYPSAWRGGMGVLVKFSWVHKIVE